MRKGRIHGWVTITKGRKPIHGGVTIRKGRKAIHGLVNLCMMLHTVDKVT
jgi:hypothetical protein